MSTLYFLDTEFIEDGKTIELISIGIVSSDGREYYAISTEFNARKASQWVKDNVLIHLPSRYAIHPMNGGGSPRLWEESLRWKSRKIIREEILQFAPPEPGMEFWADYGSYDWVAFCQLFGTMMDLPKGYPMFVHDLQQFAEDYEVELPKQEGTVHNALEDARHLKRCYDRVVDFSYVGR